MVLNEAQPNQNPSPANMRQCGNYGPTLAEFYDWLQFDPNNPVTGSPPTVPPPDPTTCAAAGFTRGCCGEPDNKCYISAGKCWCDAACHNHGNCCPDISTIGCARRKSVVNGIVITILVLYRESWCRLLRHFFDGSLSSVLTSV